MSIQPSTKDSWRKVLKHISPKNKQNLTDGDECFFDFDRIIPVPKTLNATYKWFYENWGTKCNAFNCHINKPSDDFDNETHLSFQTGWAMPDSVLKALSKQLPDITFTVKHACENLSEGCGEIAYHNGESTVKHSIDDMDIEDAYLFACEVWGEDPEE